MLGCATPNWNEDAVWSAAMWQVDLDKDGSLSADEYAKVSYGGPAFAEADADGSGSLERDEVAAMVRRLDPAGFDRPSQANGPGGPREKPGHRRKGSDRPGQGPHPAGGPGGGGAPNAPMGDGDHGATARAIAGRPTDGRRHDDVVNTLRVLQTLGEEIRDANPAEPLPTELEMALAARAGGLGSAPVQAILARLQVAAGHSGVEIPAVLFASAPLPPSAAAP
jgi:hypothetical protein